MMMPHQNVEKILKVDKENSKHNTTFATIKSLLCFYDCL